MKRHLLLLALATAAFALPACSSNDSTNPDGGMPDGGGNGGGMPDGGNHPGPKHKLTTRDLLGMPVQNLLLDPFVSTDLSYGHFVDIVFAVGGQSYETGLPDRMFLSRSPSGVALPILSIAPAADIQVGLDKSQVISPFAGGSVPFDAAVWVSAGKGKKPVTFSEAAHDLVVTLLPNDKPTSSYPLVVSGKPVDLDGRSWVRLALKSPASMPEGGWFSIVNQSSKWTFEVQAPQVTPSSGKGPFPPPDVIARGDRDGAALAAYVEITRRKR
jgi:hypothetical protein